MRAQVGKTVTERLEQLGLVPRLDVLVNNVGGIFATPAVTADGYEATLAVNFPRPGRADPGGAAAAAGQRIGPVRERHLQPGVAWTAMTQALTPQVVPSWRYIYPLVRFFHKRADPARAARVCAGLAWAASPARISGQYITERGRPGRYPAAVTGPAVGDQVISTAQNLARHAPTLLRSTAGHQPGPGECRPGA